MPPSENATQRIVRDSIEGPLGEVRHVKAGPRDIPHTVTRVEQRDGHVHFVGPAWPEQPHEYSAELARHQGNVDAAIRAALEERMYNPDATHSIEPEPETSTA